MRFIAPIVVVLIALVVLAACVASPRPNVDAQPPTVAEFETPLIATDFTPLSYHVQHCGSCHGNYAQLHPQARLRSLDDDRLHTAVREMTEGQGQAPLDDPAHLAILVRFHRFVQDDLPFVVVNVRDGARWSGEISPGAILELESSSGQRVRATVDGHKWTAPAGEYTRLIATLGEVGREKRVVTRLSKDK